MANQLQKFGIVGAGAWGTALAQMLARAGRDTILWAHKPEIAGAINRDRENKQYLPGVALDEKLRATMAMEDLSSCDAYMLVAPAQHLRSACRLMADAFRDEKPKPVVICAKGIEQKTQALMSEVVAAELRNYPVTVLSGPTFAAEAARGHPTATTLAVRDRNLGQRIVQAIGTRSFRPYLSDDIIGAEVGGAIKNVLAVACGIVTGRKMGENARAAIITRGLAEMIRLGTALGGKPETLMGLSGLGDLVLTCTGLQSRNTSLGVALGQGQKLADVLAGRNSVAEGVYTAAAALALAKRHGAEMPIVEAVDAILNRNATIDDTVAALLARPFRAEG